MFDLFKFKDLKHVNFENNTIQKQNNIKKSTIVNKKYRSGILSVVSRVENKHDTSKYINK